MNQLARLFLTSLVFASSITLSSKLTAEPISRAITYQGELRQSGTAANGVFDFEVALYGAVGASAALETLSANDITVTSGLFTLPLVFTTFPFLENAEYFLEIRVRAGASSGPYAALAPRTPISAAPYAHTALTVGPQAVPSYGIVNGAVGAQQIDQSQVQRRVNGICTGELLSISSIRADGSVTCATGNAGTITSISSNGSLIGGGNSGDVVLVLAPASVGTAEIKPNEVQRRVGTGCAVGQAIRSINADGTVVCMTDQVNGSVSGYEIVEFNCSFGAAGGATTTCTARAFCPGSKKVIGGGVSTNCLSAAVTLSHPLVISFPSSHSWVGQVVKRADVSCPAAGVATAFAICAN